MDENLRDLERKVANGQEMVAVLVRPYARAGKFAIEEIEPEQFEPHSKLHNVEGKTIDLYSERSYTIDSMAGFIALHPRPSLLQGERSFPIPGGWIMPSMKTYFSIWKARETPSLLHLVDFTASLPIEILVRLGERCRLSCHTHTTTISTTHHWLRSFSSNLPIDPTIIVGTRLSVLRSSRKSTRACTEPSTALEPVIRLYGSRMGTSVHAATPSVRLHTRSKSWLTPLLSAVASTRTVPALMTRSTRVKDGM